jgi:DNA-binding NtrC family response regulator
MSKVLVLDDDKDLCTLMIAIIKEMGMEVSCFHSFNDVSLLRRDQLNFDFAFLDVNLGIEQPSGIDVYNWLRGREFKGKVIFFTGHARAYPILQRSLKDPKVSLLEKPADIEKIQNALH